MAPCAAEFCSPGGTAVGAPAGPEGAACGSQRRARGWTSVYTTLRWTEDRSAVARDQDRVRASPRREFPRGHLSFLLITVVSLLRLTDLYPSDVHWSEAETPIQSSCHQVPKAGDACRARLVLPAARHGARCTGAPASRSQFSLLITAVSALEGTSPSPLGAE